ncbi:MAG: Uma2 family endonuclease [Leptolyngbyaceae cyanobacterium CSU_1_3]|nr:Uma2 family endonuclease [Leptolyngbyaceae cyanobacterium CSU_1_3]
MAKKPTPTEKRVTLSGVSWPQFETLLAELGSQRVARLTYDRGKLEMMTPLEEHERCSRLLESLILVFADELVLQVNSIGSVLLMRPGLACCIQPESCYYLDREVEMRRRAELNLEQVAPPDLVVEVAITKGTIDRFAIYAAMGVLEIWQYVTTIGDDALKGSLKIYQLQDGQYIESANSFLFPFLPAKRVLEFLEQSDSLGLAQALILLRSWIKGKL